MNPPSSLTLAQQLRLLGHQLRYESRAAIRNPMLIGFTIALPLLFLGIFGILIGDMPLDAIALGYRSYFAPNVVVLALLSACFASVGISLAIRRGTGELKRVRGTPLPRWIILVAIGAQAAALGVIASILVILCGRWWWSLALPAPGPLAALLAVASISLAALGVAIATFIHRPENAPAATNALLWPVAFISGTFTLVPAGSLLDRVAQLLPVRHLNQAAFAAMHPDGGTIHTGSLLVVAAWGVIGLAIAAARFSWEPSTTA